MPGADQIFFLRNLVIGTFKSGKDKNLMFGLEISSLTEQWAAGLEVIYYTGRKGSALIKCKFTDTDLNLS